MQSGRVFCNTPTVVRMGSRREASLLACVGARVDTDFVHRQHNAATGGLDEVKGVPEQAFCPLKGRLRWYTNQRTRQTPKTSYKVSREVLDFAAAPSACPLVPPAANQAFSPPPTHLCPFPVSPVEGRRKDDRTHPERKRQKTVP